MKLLMGGWHLYIPFDVLLECYTLFPIAIIRVKAILI